MRTYVFLGPTLPVEEARALLPDAVYLPPVTQGEVVALLPSRPKRIAIIDGSFEWIPAVWHKEILLALEQGVEVYGAASMGALRAAELCAFGMQGVGAIFEGYRDGVILGDDEVAVLHGPAEAGYRVRSEALVNVRATLAAAVHAGAHGSTLGNTLLRLAEGLPYYDRSWPALFHRLRAEGADEGEVSGLAAWVRDHAVDQKRLDARALLRLLAAEIAAPPLSPVRVERTIFFERLLSGARPVASGASGAVTAEDVIDHARLHLADFPALLERASARALVVQLGRRLGVEPSPQDLAAARDALAQRLGWDAVGVDAWCEENALTPADLAALVEREALLTLMLGRVLERRNDWLLDELRLSGRWTGLCAEAGRRLDRARAVPDPIADSVPGFDELLRVYLDDVGEEPPRDLVAWYRARGFDRRAELSAALVRYWLGR